MKTGFYLLSTILILLSVGCVEPAIFCDPKVDNNRLVDAVFNIYDDIYLFRGEDLWISNILIDSGKPDPTSIKIKQKFKGLDFKQLITGFVVESIPKISNCDSVEKQEQCLFNAYMLNTSFIFYKHIPEQKVQIYSMMRFDPRDLTFKFDDQIGGYGYMLRANHSIVRSTWPGIETTTEVMATLFAPEKSQIVMFLKEGTKLSIFVKGLDEEWDISVTGQKMQESMKELSGTFRRGQKYYCLTDKGFVFEMSSDFTGFLENSKKKTTEFFGCD